MPMNPYLKPEIVEPRVIEMLKQFEKVDASKVTGASHFEKDLGLDSLDTVEVIMGLEEEFVLTMPDEEALKINTVADAVAYICQHPNARPCQPLGY